MAVKASATITLTSYRDTQSVTRYYKLQPAGSSAPSKPTTKPPSSDWTDSEPACDISKELYFCDLTIFSNGEGEYSAVSKSTSYEAAKEAYNRANAAKDSIDNLEIGGRNLLTNPVYKVEDGAISNGITLNETSNTSVWEIKGTATSEVTVSLMGFTNTSTPTDSTVLLKEGQTYTESVKVEGEWPDSARIVVGISNSSGDWLSEFSLYPNTAKSHTFTATAEQYALRHWAVIIPYGERVDCAVYCKFEIGNKATDWTPAPEDVNADIDNVWEKADDAKTSIDNLEIGGRNLFLNTGKTVSNNDYKISEYAPANGSLKAGEIYTATICVTPAKNLSEISVYFSLGYLSPVSFSITETSKQIISETFTMAYYNGRTPDINPSYGYAQLYRFPNDGTVTGNTTVHWFKIEKGNRATDWTPAPEDVDSRTTALEAASAKELVRNGFAEFTNDPKLTLGKTTSPWKVVVKNDGIFLQKSSNDVASLSKETSSEETTLRADNARLANVKFRSANGGGKLGIVAQSNGHVSLKEI